MSHVSFFLELDVCDCACDEGVVTFDGVAGTRVDLDGCEVEFLGLYECRVSGGHRPLGASREPRPPRE